MNKRGNSIIIYPKIFRIFNCRFFYSQIDDIGFSANAKMCGIHDPRLEKLGTTNQPGATGEVLVNMVDIGAETRGMDYIQVLAPEAKRVGVDLRTNAKVLGIHREHALEGRVTGVEVEIGGKKLHIHATKGVIACAGGFSARFIFRTAFFALSSYFYYGYCITNCI